MSYSLYLPCFNCKKCQTTDEKENKCADAQELQEAVNRIHSKTYDKGHQGAGTIVLACSRLEAKNP